jgi:hypothetical protein
VRVTTNKKLINMRKTRTVSVYINEKEWERFKAKYPNISERLRFLIKLDLEGKLSLTAEVENDSKTD